MHQEDHRKITNGDKVTKYNDMWTDWISDFADRNRRLPNKAEVLDQLEVFRNDPELKELLGRVVRGHKLSYGQWRNRVPAKRAESTSKPSSREKQRSKINCKEQEVCEQLVELRVELYVRFLSCDVITLFQFGRDIANGRPVGEALLGSGQDFIPIWGTLRGAYQLLGDIVELANPELRETLRDLEDRVLDEIKDAISLGDEDEENEDEDNDNGTIDEEPDDEEPDGEEGTDHGDTGNDDEDDRGRLSLSELKEVIMKI